MRHLALLGLAVGVGLLGGCNQNDRAEVRQEVQGMRQQMQGAAEVARQATADATLTGKVKTALATRKGLDEPNLHINVDSKDGHVILKGDVSSRAQAELAERTAKEIEGVNTVENQLMLRVPAKEAAPAIP